MDEDNIVIKSRFLQGIIERELTRWVCRATGANNIEFRFSGPITVDVGDAVKIHAGLDIITDQKNIRQIMKNRG